MKIGFPFPDFTAHFVGTFEIVCGEIISFIVRELAKQGVIAAGI